MHEVIFSIMFYDITSSVTDLAVLLLLYQRNNDPRRSSNDHQSENLRFHSFKMKIIKNLLFDTSRKTKYNKNFNNLCSASSSRCDSFPVYWFADQSAALAYALAARICYY